MSLSNALLRSFNRSILSVRPCRKFYTSSLANTYVTSPKLAQTGACESHMERNERLKRPLSPHLSIYNIELTSGLSVTHRTTGIILSAYAITLSVAGLCGGVDGIISTINGWCLPPAILYIGKYLLSVPVTFHFFNGIRHLLWDMGKFLTIREVYSTGYAVIALSIVSALIVSAM